MNLPIRFSKRASYLFQKTFYPAEYKYYRKCTKRGHKKTQDEQGNITNVFNVY